MRQRVLTIFGSDNPAVASRRKISADLPWLPKDITVHAFVPCGAPKRACRRPRARGAHRFRRPSMFPLGRSNGSAIRRGYDPRTDVSMSHGATMGSGRFKAWATRLATLIGPLIPRGVKVSMLRARFNAGLASK